MSPSSRSALLCLALAGGLALRAQEISPPGLYGVVKGSHYTIASGLFRVAVPVLPELGGQVHDTENVVTFDDDVSTHVSIAAFPFDLSQKWEFETRGVRDYLAYFYAEFVFPDFLQRHPGSLNEASEFSPELQGGALLVYTLLPGGSFFEDKASVLPTPRQEPPVAKRGTLLFVREGAIFILSAELAERVTQRSTFQKTPAEENALLRERLLALVGRMTIPAPKPAARNP